MPPLRSGGGTGGIFTAEDQLNSLVYGGSDVAPPVEPGMYEEPYVAPGQYAEQAPAPVSDGSAYGIGYQPGAVSEGYQGDPAAQQYAAPTTAPAPATAPPGGDTEVSTLSPGAAGAQTLPASGGNNWSDPFLPQSASAAPAVSPPPGGATEYYGGEAAHMPLGNSREVATLTPSTGQTSYRAILPTVDAPERFSRGVSDGGRAMMAQAPSTLPTYDDQAAQARQFGTFRPGNYPQPPDGLPTTVPTGATRGNSVADPMAERNAQLATDWQSMTSDLPNTSLVSPSARWAPSPSILDQAGQAASDFDDWSQEFFRTPEGQMVADTIEGIAGPGGGMGARLRPHGQTRLFRGETGGEFGRWFTESPGYAGTYGKNVKATWAPSEKLADWRAETGEYQGKPIAEYIVPEDVAASAVPMRGANAPRTKGDIVSAQEYDRVLAELAPTYAARKGTGRPSGLVDARGNPLRTVEAPVQTPRRAGPLTPTTMAPRTSAPGGVASANPRTIRAPSTTPTTMPPRPRPGTVTPQGPAQPPAAPATTPPTAVQPTTVTGRPSLGQANATVTQLTPLQLRRANAGRPVPTAGRVTTVNPRTITVAPATAPATAPTAGAVTPRPPMRLRKGMGILGAAGLATAAVTQGEDDWVSPLGDPTTRTTSGTPRDTGAMGRPTMALTPDGSVIPTERTSDAWGGGTGPSAVDVLPDGTALTIPPSRAVWIDPATGAPSISDPAYVDQDAYNAARERGAEPWQFNDAEVDFLVTAGLVQPDPTDPTDLTAVYDTLMNAPALIPPEWVEALNAAYDAGEIAPAETAAAPSDTATAPADTLAVYPVNGSSAAPSAAPATAPSTGGGGSGWVDYGSGGGGGGRSYGGRSYGGGGGGYPSTMPAFSFDDGGSEQGSSPWDNPIFDRFFATAGGQLTGLRGRPAGRTRGRRGRPTTNRRTRSGRVQNQMPMPPLGGSAGAEALAAALALRER